MAAGHKIRHGQRGITSNGRTTKFPPRSLEQSHCRGRQVSVRRHKNLLPSFLPPYCTTAKLPSLAPHLIHPPCRVGRSIREGKSGEEEVSVFILAESNAERASVHSFALLDTFHNTHSLGARQEKLCVHACRVLKTKNCKSHSA